MIAVQYAAKKDPLKQISLFWGIVQYF